MSHPPVRVYKNRSCCGDGHADFMSLRASHINQWRSFLSIPAPLRFIKPLNTPSTVISSTPTPSFPHRRAVYGTRTIRWQHLSAASRESRRDSSETRQSTGRMHGGRHRHTGFKAVSTGRGTPSVIPAISTVIADLIRNPEVKGGHTTRQHNQPRTVILALRQYPQGGAHQASFQPSAPSLRT